MWYKSILYLVPSSVVFARFHLPIVGCTHIKDHQSDISIIGILDGFTIIFYVKQLLLKVRAKAFSVNNPTSVANWLNVNYFCKDT